MKLELKHWTSYLPFNVNVERIHFKNERFKNLSAYDLCHDGELNNIKLILHPLSDLTKEIDMNGEKIIPCHYLAKMSIDNRTTDFIEIRSNKYDWSTIISNLKCYEKLLEWHFDIFGLIDAGLAVDINTVSF